MKNKLNPYRGRLSPSEIAAGMNAAKRNSRRLAEDAQALLKLNRFPSAAALAILSIEEAGKESILRELALARGDDDLMAAWKRYRSHTCKNVAWILPQLVLDGARSLADLQPIFDEASDHPHVLDQLKQVGLYTDCLGTRHWSIPEDVMDERLARSLVDTAHVLSQGRYHSSVEVELWIRHVGPVWKRDSHLMKKALVDWATAMQEAGLVEGMEGFKDFVRRRPATDDR